MNKIKNLFSVSLGKMACLAVLLAVVFTAAMPALAQTADVRYAGVFYKNQGDVYCNYGTGNQLDFVQATGVHNRSFVYVPTPISNNTEDPWVSSALIEYDQPYPDGNDDPNLNRYPNHCLALCMKAYCNNKPLGGSTYSITFPLQQIKFDIVKYYNNKNVENPEETPAIRTIDIYPNTEEAKCGSYRCPGASESGFTCNSAQYYCTDPVEGRTGNSVSGYTYTARCRDNYCYRFSDGVQDDGCNECPGGVCNFAVWNNDGTPSIGNQAIPFCAAWDGAYSINGEFGKTNGQFAFRATVATDVPGDNIITDKITFNSTIAYPGMNQIPIQVDVTNIHTVRSTPSLVGNITAVSAQPYTYAYRLSKDADVRIGIFDASTKDSAEYGPNNLMRCIGNFVTGVGATACKDQYRGVYAYFYQGTDTPTLGCCDDAQEHPEYITNAIVGYPDLVRTLVDWQPRLGEGMKGVENDVQITEFDSWDGRDDNGLLLPAGNYVVSLQAKTQDEWPGVDFSRAVTRQLSLDPLKLTDVVATGLTKQSTAYATIAYTPTESSKVYWYVFTPGTTFNTASGGTPAAVFTNSAVQTGTAPSPIAGTGSLVYKIEEDRLGRMNFTSKWDGLCGIKNGEKIPYLIHSQEPFPTGAVDEEGNPLTGLCNDTTGEKTDCIYYVIQNGCTRKYAKGEKLSNGIICGSDIGCTETFEYGAPMPDGNYVYALWAEIPYNGCYYNKASGETNAPVFAAGSACGTNGHTNTTNGQAFSGVKTLKYDIGQVAIERGVVDITIQPVSYATIGSSPTAYGLDPFIFKYSISRDATVIAKVTNTAGVTVKYLTPENGISQVAQQMNTISWDGRDDAGRMVTPATYMLVVETKDAMFPAVTNRAVAVFPVDMYRLVDVSTTDVYGDSNAKATISYALSKAMNVQLNIYNKDVVIPNYNDQTGEYGQLTNATPIGSPVSDVFYVPTVPYMVNATLSDGTAFSGYVHSGTQVSYGQDPASGYYRDTVTVTAQGSLNSEWSNGAGHATVPHSPSALNPGHVTVQIIHMGEEGALISYFTNDVSLINNSTTIETQTDGTNTYYLIWNTVSNGSNYDVSLTVYDYLDYQVHVVREYLNVTAITSPAAWPPRLCDKTTDMGVMKLNPTTPCPGTFAPCYVDPALFPQCIYVNDTTFTNYPADATQAVSEAVDVRLKPIQTFDRSSLKPGDGLQLMEEWDALYFRNPSKGKCPDGTTDTELCPYEMVPDGSYPFFISARSNEPFDRYYYDRVKDKGATLTGSYWQMGTPFTVHEDVQQEDYLYATDKVVSKLNITRGPVYFLDGSTVIYSNAPQLFNVSSGPVFIPPYEINFSVSRAATVEVAIVALQAGVCNPDPTIHQDLKNNLAGDVCKYLSTMTIANTGHFDPTIVRKTYWDGTDNNGFYVKPGVYEVRLIARNYPDPGLYQSTVKSLTLNADLLKVFDLLEADGYAISERGTDMKIGYQLSVPMKVGIQIFKPGTTIYDYQKGTLRNPTTGLEVQDVREVLVKAITGIRPGTTLIEEVWDGTDYAGQEVPDGTYPFRFVTSLNSANIDSVTGEIIGDWGKTDGQNADPSQWKINKVADTYEYQNLHKATIAIGDGRFVCEDWEKTVFFYPNPFTDASKGTLEITKMPVPGEVSIKYYNLAGDLVRDSGYTCVDANNYQVTMNDSLTFNPDNTPNGSTPMGVDDLQNFPNVRNAAMRCRWDKTNQHGKKVARGVYFGLVDFKAKMGREHCQKVVKILIP